RTSTVSSMASWPRAATMIWQPSLARMPASWRPTPLLPPETNATFPAIPKSIGCPLGSSNCSVPAGSFGTCDRVTQRDQLEGGPRVHDGGIGRGDLAGGESGVHALQIEWEVVRLYRVQARESPFRAAIHAHDR